MPRQFKHSDVVRAYRAAEAVGVSNPTIHIRCPNGSVITIDGKPDAAVAVPKHPSKPPPTSPRSPRGPK